MNFRSNVTRSGTVPSPYDRTKDIEASGPVEVGRWHLLDECTYLRYIRSLARVEAGWHSTHVYSLLKAQHMRSHSCCQVVSIGWTPSAPL